MRKAYQDHSLSYGFETETLSLMSFLTAKAMMYLFQKDYTSLFNVIDVLYVSTKERIKNHLPESFEDKYRFVETAIFSEDLKSVYDRSDLFIQTRELWGLMAVALTKSDLMFRSVIDPSTMVTNDTM